MSKEPMEVTFDLAEAFKNETGDYPTLADVDGFTEEYKDYLYFSTLSDGELSVYLNHLRDANQRNAVVKVQNKRRGIK